MHRRHLLLLSLFTAVAALLPAWLGAAPIVIGAPTSKTVYVGTPSANTTIDVAAVSSNGGTLSYQWKFSTDNGANFNPVPNASPYGNVTTANLTINCTDTSLNNNGNGSIGTKYKCFITDSSDSANITTNGATLHVFGTPSNTATVHLSTPTIAANSTENLTITVSGLAVGDKIKVQHFLDSAGTDNVDVVDPLLESFIITENQTASFGGVTDPNLPGDDVVHTPNGTITTHINLSTSSELSRIAGNHIIKIASPNNDFAAISTNFTVTKPAYSQSVSGTAMVGSAPLPNARVGMLQQTGGGNSQFVAGTLADSGGNFTLNAPVGTGYLLLIFQPGYISNFQTAPQFALTTSEALTNTNPVATAATCMIGGKTQDANGNGVAGMQLFISSNSNNVTIATSNNDGVFVAPALADTWSIEVSDTSVNQVGYLRPSNKPTADTTAANSLNLSIVFPVVNALVYGTVKNGNTGLTNVEMDGNDNNNLNVSANTDANGNYYLGVNAPINTNNAVADNWNVNANSTSSGLSGLIAPSSQSAQLFSGQSMALNFVAAAATATLNGTVKDANSGQPVIGALIDAMLQNNGNGPGVQVQSTTDGSGNFSLGVYAGNWTVFLSSQDNNNNPVNAIGPQINETVADGNHLTVQYNNSTIPYFPIANGTASINGTVTDINGNPLSFNGINASANINIGGIGVVNYSSSAQTQNDGSYSLPVVNGTWSVSPGQSGYTSQNVTVSGSNQNVINFSPGFNITMQPNNQDVPAGQPANFSIQTNAVSNVTYQWQNSTDSGNTWSNISNNANFSGNTNATLTVSNTTSALSGQLYRCVATYSTTSTTLDSNSASLIVSTAALIGTVTNNGTPVANLTMQAQLINNGGGGSFVTAQGTTDSNGNFSLGVYGGNWTLQLNNFTNGQPNNLIGPNLQENVTDGQNINGIAYPVLTDTATISGHVVDINGNPVTNNGMFATATINGNIFNVNSLTDNGGNYSLAVVNGIWHVTPSSNGNSNGYASQNVTVNNNNPGGINFAQSIITQQPLNQVVTAGQSAQFNVQTGTSSNTTFQWQSSPDNSTWSNLTNNAPYSGVTNATLFINNASSGLSGEFYRCVVTYTNTLNVTSNTNTHSAGLIVNTPPGISSQPSGTTVFAGANVTFNLTGNGSPLPSYQWQISTNNGGNWSNLTDNGTYTGSTTPSLTVNATTTTMSTNQFRCVLSSVAGSITSNGVILFVNPSFVTWQQTYFNQSQLNNPAISGPTAAPGQDGIANLVKYAFNLAPLSNQQANLPHATISAGKLTLVFNKTASDITYTVQSSTDLVTWSTTDPSLSVQTNGSQVTASYTMTGHPTAFLRILITKP